MAKKRATKTTSETSMPATKSTKKKATKKKAAKRKAATKARVAKKKAANKSAAPSQVAFDLYAPGMTPLHRAGLGGLAATLRALERRVRLGLLPTDRVPGDWDGSGNAPWSYDDRTLTLDWSEPSAAGEYLKRLFAFGFGIKGGLIDLPGTYDLELSTPVRVELQLGLTLTFLQFGPHRKLADEQAIQLDPDGDGVFSLVVRKRVCSRYLHQDFCKKLTLKNGSLTTKPVEQPSAFSPGTVVRHNAFGSQTRIDVDAPTAICAAFAIVGCLSIAINRGMGVLVIPEVVDLAAFAKSRARMTPKFLADCRTSGLSEAALQTLLRLRSRAVSKSSSGVVGVHAMRLRPTQWNSKQKSRVDAIELSLGRDKTLAKFEQVLAELPRQVRSKLDRQAVGRGQAKQTSVEPIWFFTDSLVRPLIADNLARERRWYRALSTLLRGRDEKGRRLIERVGYETNALHQLALPQETDGMAELTSDQERQFIEAIHDAIRSSLGRIKSDTDKGNESLSQAVKNRWERYKERARLSILNTKNAEQMRGAIVDILARSGDNKVLRESSDYFPEIRQLLYREDWRVLRDLALLALISYRPADRSDAVNTDAPSDQEPANVTS